MYAVGHFLRSAEQSVLEMFSMGQVQGTTHTCIGQELCQMAVVRALTHVDDHVFSNHRNHGHFLTFSGNLDGLLSEVAGREGGVCQGYGGSQHLAIDGFHSNGVQAGMTAIAVGTALSLSRSSSEGIVAAVVGDGTLGEGLLYESLNLSGVWSAPILFVVENNRIAQTTPQAMALSGDIAARGSAFGLDTWRVSDCEKNFFVVVDEIVSEVRSKRRPGFLVIDTHRLGPHSKGDDLRDPAEIESIRQLDPLAALGNRLPRQERERIESTNNAFVSAALSNVLARSPVHRLRDWQPAPLLTQQRSTGKSPEGLTVAGAIGTALRDSLARHPRMLLLGEDLHDPYGGAFKITKGLSTSFPGRVISTPISEAGITGVGIGLALQGWHVVVEIMFADFLTLSIDQLCNHATKFPYLFDRDVALVMRSPAGGGRGYGPTHSQSPESIMASIPGLPVIYPSHRHDCGAILAAAITNCRSPVMFMEHKLLYQRPQDAGDFQCHSNADVTSLFPAMVRKSLNPDLTIVTYGGALILVEEVAKVLEQKEELSVEIVVPSLLTPQGINDALAAISTSRVCVVEECPGQFSIGSQMIAQLVAAPKKIAVRQVGASPVPIPSARTLEMDVLPNVDVIFTAALDMVLNS
ncbi:alpha-ketoacid dehydrogenase subunit alpha/beta [Rhizobium sp. P32RR-XVIII]|uniref:dehydrogenase E1 component subunit alpha/beta n=1 Tax=Rhizobium sp. P32RR-XVIII TaxID=2726738 RepID=UPI0019822DF0|nr:alpha-ketoacid dehydrogenase subunit alpha/beta [Rhizobium sp. P32RR-XVIII]